MGEERLDVDMEDLCYAYDDFNLENMYFLDLETGEMIFVSHFLDEGEELLEEIEPELGDRYVSLPRSTSREGYKDMEDFIGTVEDDDLREKLNIAIDGQGAFRRFKGVLKKYPKERERWFEFKNSRTEKRVRRWLEGQGIEIVEEDS